MDFKRLLTIGLTLIAALGSALFFPVVAGGSQPADGRPAAGSIPTDVKLTSVSPERLICEYRENPLGIATTKPRLGWRLRATDASGRGAAQSAYRIAAAATPEDLAREEPLVWDTGKVAGPEGARTMQIEYAGKPLSLRNRVWWKVTVWDEQGRPSGWSEPAFFGIGFVKPSTGWGQWIGLTALPSAPLTEEIREELRRRPWIRLSGGPERQARTGYFRTEFELPAGAINDAWLAVTPDMLASVRINGRAAAELARWEPLRAVDVAALLTAGKNAIGVSVEQQDGFNPALSGMLVVRMEDGQERRVVLDGSWKCTERKAQNVGPSSDEPAGFDRIGFADANWKPVEVSGSQPWGANRNTEHFLAPAPYLRTVFSTTEGKIVTRATLYSTALGLYECSINGAKVGDAELAPGWTEYPKRVEQQTNDVTAMIVPGSNCLGAILGDGWYAGLMAYTGQRHFYGAGSRLKAELEIEYTDGSTQRILTGPDWKASFGPIRHADNYMGCDYDARREMPGWNTPGFNASSWESVQVGIAQAKRRESDVTERVRAALGQPGGKLRVGPETLGDPAFGTVKLLKIYYEADGRPDSIGFLEGQTVTLPLRGEKGPTLIKRATFGEPEPDPREPLIEGQAVEPVRRHEELPARSVSEPRPGRFVFDLGQNMVGWVRLKVDGKSGQRLTVRHAEMLNPDGTLYTSNLRGATATDFFTLKDGSQTLEPKFTFHGFRYVEITGLSSKPDPSMLTGIVINTALRPAGTFECSNPLINQLVSNIRWSQKGNFVDLPTDCPQRDERLGWTGNAQFFVNTAAYTFEIAAFMSRWLRTLNQDAQFPDGRFAHVAPKVNEGGGATAWGDAAIICAHAVYRTYGDTRVISNNYEAMLAYMKWLDGKTKDGISTVGGFGDWLNLGDPTSPDLIDTAYRVALCRAMSEMAGVIGKAEDAKRFTDAGDAALTAFQRRFLAEDGSLRESGQTGYALAFTIGLLPNTISAKSAQHFESALAGKSHHLATGFIGTPRLLPALYAAGKAPLAARLLMNEDYPSWLYQVKLGATTMWERWDGWTPERGFSDVGMNSFNHYAFGSVGEYLYRHVAGISALAPGYTKVLIAPTLTAGLDHAAATYDSPSGMIKSAWKRTANGAEYEITIPPNVKGEIRLAASDQDTILEGGARVAGLGKSGAMPAAGISPLAGQEPNVVRLEVTSGAYRFEVKTAR